MIKVKSVLITLTPLVLLFPQPVHAQAQPISDIYAPAKAMGGSNATIGAFISPLIQDFMILTGLAVLVILLLAGFNYVSSGGDKAKVQQSTNMLLYGLIGLILAVAALAITQIIGRIAGFNFFAPGV